MTKGLTLEKRTTLQRHRSGIWVPWQLLPSFRDEGRAGERGAKLAFSVIIRIRERMSHLDKPLSRVFTSEFEKMKAD